MMSKFRKINFYYLAFGKHEMKVKFLKSPLEHIQPYDIFFFKTSETERNGKFLDVAVFKHDRKKNTNFENGTYCLCNAFKFSQLSFVLQFLWSFENDQLKREHFLHDFYKVIKIMKKML